MLPDLHMNNTSFKLPAIRVFVIMAPVKIKIFLLSYIYASLTYAILILSKVHIRSVRIIRKICMRIGISNFLNQMAFHTINGSGRFQRYIF